LSTVEVIALPSLVPTDIWLVKAKLALPYHFLLRVKLCCPFGPDDIGKKGRSEVSTIIASFITLLLGGVEVEIISGK
jgi:hypothetical protein